MNRFTKANMIAFATQLRRHTPESLGRDLGCARFINALNNAAHSDKFGSANEFFDKVVTITKGLNTIKNIHSGLVENGFIGGSNSEHSMVPFTSESISSPIGKNDAVYYKTRIHIGRKTSSRIRKIKDGPFVDNITRLTSSSNRDYLNHNKRSQLNLKSGFNEKGFSFLMEDTYFSVKDYYDLLDIDKKYKKELESVKDGKKDIYACVLNTHHRLKIKNRMDYHTNHVKIHLIKILDLETDVIDLIKEITHNSQSTEEAGKLPLDQQYSDPILRANQFAINFRTALSCSLNLSSKFKERAKIVKSWSRTIPPGSIWEFNLTHHLGKGIYINRLYDIQSEKNQTNTTKDRAKKFLELIEAVSSTANQTTTKTLKENLEFFTIANNKLKKKLSEHPTGYIFCLEYVGDRRASVINAQNDLFSGYSPCNLNIEFDTEIKFLANQEDSDNILVYKKIIQEKNFEEDSPLGEIFYPSRLPSFHLSYDELMGKKSKYKLVLDQTLKANGDFSPVLDLLNQKLEEYGIKAENLSPDDLNFNMASDPSKPDSEQEYEGTEEKVPDNID